MVHAVAVQGSECPYCKKPTVYKTCTGVSAPHHFCEEGKKFWMDATRTVLANPLPVIKPIPICVVHNVMGCRECFPVTVDVKDRLPVCKTHGAEGCRDCWGRRTV